jgi:hypothetical protein
MEPRSVLAMIDPADGRLHAAHEQRRCPAGVKTLVGKDIAGPAAPTRCA